MTLRQFQYCITGYDAREKRKMDMLTNLAIMIDNPKAINKFLSPNKTEPWKSAKTKEEIRERNIKLDAEIQGIRNSPTYTKREITLDQMFKQLKIN